MGVLDALRGLWRGVVPEQARSPYTIELLKRLVYDGAAPAGPAGGDLGGSYPDPSVVGIQNVPVLGTAPVKGNSLLFDGTNWVPTTLALAGGATGEVFFFCQSDAAEPPIVGLPVGTKELDPAAHLAPVALTSGALPPAPTYVAGYVTNVDEPGVGVIPLGLWTFRIWCEASVATAGDTEFLAEIYTYDDSAAPTLLATTAPVSLYLPSLVTQYAVSVVVPQTVVALTTRIYVVLKAASATGGTITFHFGDSTPSFVQTTVSTISGTGIPHVIDGITQPDATPIDLASADVTGVLPDANQAPQTMGGDVTGTTAVSALALVGAAGTYGSATVVPVLTTDTKGRVTGVVNTPITGFSPSLRVLGSFSDSTDQAATLANTAYYMKYNTVELSNGVTLANNTSGNPTRIVVSESGIYEFQFSAQLHKTGGTKTLVSFWAVKNRESGGGPIARTNSMADIGGSTDNSFPFFAGLFSLSAGDYVEWAWSADNTGVTLEATGAQAGPTRPADPSIIVNVKKISTPIP